ncbi:MAG: DUF1214 domain-containing protein [Xanthomonadales bacterium]|nr:DUF1214 domain-containing protein [Xanthomonadales bacterium]
MRLFTPMLALNLLLAGMLPASAGQTVTVDNFVRAETDRTLARYVEQGAFGRFVHIRQPTPIDAQDVIRMNRDTLYSAGVFDLSSPVTIEKPASPDRFQSMMLVNQNHSILPAVHEGGTFVYTREDIGTRYLFVIIRTFMDASDPEDIRLANALQDQVTASQASVGSFDVPDWDAVSLARVRDAINVLASTKTDISGFFGQQDQLNPIDHLLGAAYGWGGNPREAAMYINVVPEKNDGLTPYTLTVGEVPVDGFWSVTVYNAAGYMERNPQQAYAFNDVTAAHNEDGTITLHFGGDPSLPNYLPITPGWNYIVRLYQPQEAFLSGAWTFPEPMATE